MEWQTPAFHIISITRNLLLVEQILHLKTVLSTAMVVSFLSCLDLMVHAVTAQTARLIRYLAFTLRVVVIMIVLRKALTQLVHKTPEQVHFHTSLLLMLIACTSKRN